MLRCGGLAPRVPRNLRDLRIEVAVAIHRVLKDLDRAGQCTDLVGAAGVRNLHPFGAIGDLLDGRGDYRKRAGDRTGDDQHAHDHHHQREDAEAGQHKGHRVVGVGLLRDFLAAFGVDPGQRLEVLVQRYAHFAVGVIVAPLASRGSIDLDTAANQFLAEIDELFDALLEGGELLGVVGLDQRLPALDDLENALVELEQSVAVFLHHGRISRHVDAARFHYHRIDQRIDALDVEGGAARVRHRFRQFGVLAGVVVGQSGDDGDQHCEQREDGVQLGCERKPGHGATKKLMGHFAISAMSALPSGGRCRWQLKLCAGLMDKLLIREFLRPQPLKLLYIFHSLIVRR